MFTDNQPTMSRRSIADSRYQMTETDERPLTSARVPVGIQPKLITHFLHRPSAEISRHATPQTRIAIQRGTLITASRQLPTRKEGEKETLGNEAKREATRNQRPSRNTEVPRTNILRPRFDSLQTNHMLKIEMISLSTLRKQSPDSNVTPGNSSLPVELSSVGDVKTGLRNVRSRQATSSLSKRSASKLSSALRLKLHRVPQTRRVSILTEGLKSETVNFFDFDFDESQLDSRERESPVKVGDDDINDDDDRRYQIDTIVDHDEFLDNLPSDFHRYLEEKKTLQDMKTYNTLSKPASRKPSFGNPVAFMFDSNRKS